MDDIDLEELRSELDEFAGAMKRGGRSARDERIIAGFEDIQRWVERNGRSPQHREEADIFERLCAVRLDRLKALEGATLLLRQLDWQGLLYSSPLPDSASGEAVSDNELRAELAGMAPADGILALRHVRSGADKRTSEEIANRTVCEDFASFAPIFEQVRSDVKTGVRRALPVQEMDELKMTEIQAGECFVVEGQFAYVAEVGELFTTQYDRRDSRLRVIYDNATESHLLMRSFQRALHRDPAARIITNPENGPLFVGEPAADDVASGTIYVLRSKSNDPFVIAHRDVLHKIGVTGGSVETRIANARLDPTFLLADVEVVATYGLYNISRTKLENVIHRMFARAQADIEITDRFGNPVRPREWFLVPLRVVDEVVEHIRHGRITQYVYDPAAARLVRVVGGSLQ